MDCSAGSSYRQLMLSSQRELMREHVWHPPQFATRESWFVAVGDGDFTQVEAAMPISDILASHVRKVMPVMNGEI